MHVQYKRAIAAKWLGAHHDTQLQLFLLRYMLAVATNSNVYARTQTTEASKSDSSEDTYRGVCYGLLA
jgi:hypothetical protein